jgi:fructose-1,6-bisphosphatase
MNTGLFSKLKMNFTITIICSFYKAIGEFVLTDIDIKIPKRGSILSINEGYSHMWDEAVKEYVSGKKDPKVRDIFLQYSCIHNW